MEKDYIKNEEKIDFTKVDTPPLKYELKTNPVKDAEGRIVEPARYLDAESFEEQVARVWSLLSDEQKVEFYLEMERMAALNRETDLTSGMHK